MSHQRVGPAPNETRQRMARSFFCPNYFGLLFHRRRRRRLGSARLIGRPGFYVQLDFRSFFFGRGGYFFLLFMAVFARAVSVAAALRPPIGFFLLFFCCRFIGRFFSFAGGDLGGYYWISLALLLRPLLFHRRRSVDIRLD